MRELKFRAWDKVEKQMVNDLFDYKSDRIESFTLEDLNELFSEKDFVFMQFTGQKDKNGKEIYEGDVVYTPHATKMEADTGVVVWGDNGFALDLEGYIDMVRYRVYLSEPYLEERHSLEVIGNIYENPELLATKQKEGENG